MKLLSLISLLLTSSLIYAQSSSYQHQNASAETAFDDLDAEFGEAPKRAPVKKAEPAPVKNITIIQQKIVHVHQAAPTPEPKISEINSQEKPIQNTKQTWMGEYVCSQGKTNTEVKINLNKQFVLFYNRYR